MIVIWKNVESTVQPLEVDDQSSPNGIYIRQNIISQIKNDITYWLYEESFLTLNEYQLYLMDKLNKKINSL